MQEAFSLVPSYQVSVDLATGAAIAGKMYCGIRPDGVAFSDIQQLILTMDHIMDEIAFPQSTVEKRTFQKPMGFRLNTSRQQLLEMRRFMADKQAGDQATFIVQVEYRHEAEWQGSVKWVEGEQTREFASTLELIKFLDETGSACQSENAEKAQQEIERVKL